MMYGFDGGWGWMWLGDILAALIVLVVRAFSSDASSQAGQAPKAPASSVRQIIEERLARGEITPDEFRQLAAPSTSHSQ